MPVGKSSRYTPPSPVSARRASVLANRSAGLGADNLGVSPVARAKKAKAQERAARIAAFDAQRPKPAPAASQSRGRGMRRGIFSRGRNQGVNVGARVNTPAASASKRPGKVKSSVVPQMQTPTPSKRGLLRRGATGPGNMPAGPTASAAAAAGAPAGNAAAGGAVNNAVATGSNRGLLGRLRGGRSASASPVVVPTAPTAPTASMPTSASPASATGRRPVYPNKQYLNPKRPGKMKSSVIPQMQTPTPSKRGLLRRIVTGPGNIPAGPTASAAAAAGAPAGNAAAGAAVSNAAAAAGAPAGNAAAGAAVNNAAASAGTATGNAGAGNAVLQARRNAAANPPTGNAGAGETVRTAARSAPTPTGNSGALGTMKKAIKENKMYNAAKKRPGTALAVGAGVIGMGALLRGREKRGTSSGSQGMYRY